MGLVGIIILVIIGIIIVFLICREIVCWYWKINTLVELMTEQNRLLSEIAKKSSSLSQENISSSGNNSVPVNRNYGDTWICKKCGEKNPNTSSSCKGCGEYK
jgi:hypothetical protein